MERFYLAEIYEEWVGTDADRGELRSRRISPIFSSSEALDSWITRNSHVNWLDWVEVVHQWGKPNELGLREESRTNLEYWFV
jgi:hypothetical protein